MSRVWATIILLAFASGYTAEPPPPPPLPVPPIPNANPAPSPPAENTPAHWQEVVKSRLQKKITLSLDESTLSDALANMRQMATVAIFTDPALTDDEQGDINQTFSDLPLSDALPRLLGPLGLEYVIRDEAIFVFRRNAYAEDASAAGSLPDKKVNDLNAAITELSSDDFRVREHGSETLAKFGNAAAPYLAKAARASTDPEAQLRLRRLGERYAAKPFPEPTPDVARKLDAIDAFIATDFESTRVGDAALFIAAQIVKKTGAPLVVQVDSALRDQPVYMPPAVMHAGNMLRWLAVLSGSKIVLEGEQLKLIKR